jgi:hypothetical protein
MGRRFEASVRPHLPAGVRDIVVVGLANDYLGYFTTPRSTTSSTTRAGTRSSASGPRCWPRTRSSG